MLRDWCRVDFFLFILSIIFSINVSGQVKVYASAIVSEEYVENSSLAMDQDLSTRARIKANSGVVAGIGQYSGHLELKFAGTLPANTTSYIRITTDDSLLPHLLGGSLGELLATVASALLVGQQEFSVDVKDSAGTVVLHGDSQDAGELAASRMKIVENAAGQYLIMITPNQPYNRIRLTSRLGSLLGLNTTKRLDVYETYYITDPAPCADAAYTSFSGRGITIDALQLGQAGVLHAQHAIDASPTTYSTLSLGLLGVGASIEQTVYFEGPSQAADQFGIKLRAGQALLNANIAGNITITASNGGTVVQSKSLTELLTLNSILISGGQQVVIPMAPGAPVDRITIKLTALVSVSVAQTLDFFGVSRTVAMPLITQNYSVCEGSTATLIATGVAGAQLKWYATAAGGTPLVTVIPGQGVTTSILTNDTTYYVSQVIGSCESLLLPVTVKVLIRPGSGTIEGEQTICLNKTPGILNSVIADSGAGISYRWESSLTGQDWATVADANQAAYQPGGLSAITYFRRITIRTIDGVMCESAPSNVLKITARNCQVVSNPMVRQRIRNGV